MEVMEFESYLIDRPVNIPDEGVLIEIVKHQKEIIELLKQGFQFTISLIALTIGLIVIITFIRGVFRNVGN